MRPSHQSALPLEDRLRQWAHDRGYSIAWGPADLLAEAQNRINQRNEQGVFDPRFFGEALAGVMKPMAEAPSGTVLCVAIPRPAHRLVFETATGPFTVMVPPTYVSYGRVMDGIAKDLVELLAPTRLTGLRRMPLKSLAVRVGLAKYGRNNVTYTPATGSLHQLAAYLIDPRLDSWPGLQDLESMLPHCSDCKACERACPTGAISDDRYLLHGERCVTYLNEFPYDFPEWTPANAHSAIIGCMRCISACPANRGKLKVELIPQQFSRAETEAILAGHAEQDEPVWIAIKDKLAALDCGLEVTFISRNLSAVMSSQQG